MSELIRALRGHGYDIESIAESKPSISDEEVLAYAVAEQRILITEDIGFGELIFKHQYKATSVILIRFSHVDPQEQISIVLDFLTRARALEGHFTVLSKEQVRIRKINGSS